MQATVVSGRVASPARRLGGYLLDVFYSVAVMLVLSAIAPEDEDGSGLVLVLFVAYVIAGIYFWSKGTSPGKMTLGMYVHSQETGERLGFWMMLLRETIGKWLSGLIFGIGYLWILFDDNRQGWHDKLVGSVVVESG